MNIRKLTRYTWHIYYSPSNLNRAQLALHQLNFLKELTSADMRHINKLFPEDKEPKKKWIKVLEKALAEAISARID